MTTSDADDTSSLEWKIGGVVLALIAAFVGWAALRPRGNDAAAAPRPIVEQARGAPLRSETTPPAEAPAAKEQHDEPPSAPTAALDVTPVTLDTLSNFDYEPPRQGFDESGPKPAKPVADQVPKTVRALSEKRVAVEGYMLPFDFDDDKCTKFALSLIPPGCCFGCGSRPNNWIEVTMADGKKAPCANVQVTVRAKGVLKVHGRSDDGSPLYTMTCDAVEATR